MAKHQAIHMNITVRTDRVEVDSDGNLVIKNKELAKKVRDFLASEEGQKIAKAEYFLLCCKLRPPKPP